MNMMSPDPVENTRQDRMSVIALSDEADLSHLWKQLNIEPDYTALRGPETGLLALRGRIGGGGSPFNFGDCTVTRATVELEGGHVGHAVIMGRSHEKARLAAILDALAQNEAFASQIQTNVVEPLRSKLQEKDQTRQQETAATKVDFFTLVRGDD